MPETLELMGDLAAARWVEASLAPRPWASVGNLVPDNFEAYARILHPAHRGKHATEGPVSWATVAEETGRVLHPLAQFARIANLGDDWNAQPSWGRRPFEGSLPEEVVGPLAEAARSYTNTRERCWFCVWEGFGQLNYMEGYEDAPRVTIPGRKYLLFRGALDVVRSFPHELDGGPQIWWPDDRAWCVATEIDLDSTYVGGGRDFVDRLIGDPGLEVMPAALNDRVDFGADTINT
ncbi:MAG: hypothetical protein ACRDJI_08845 [Actinomycetota bacterium]